MGILGLKGIEPLLRGADLDGAVILCEAPESLERNSICNQYVREGLNQGEKVLVVLTRDSVDSMMTNLQNLNVAARDEVNKGRLAFIDLSPTVQSKDADGLMKLSSDILAKLTEFLETAGKRVLISDLKDILSILKDDQKEGFIESLVGQIRLETTLSLVMLETKDITESEIEQIHEPFDGILRVIPDRVEGGFMIGVVSFYDVVQTGIYLPLKKSGEEFVVGSSAAGESKAEACPNCGFQVLPRFEVCPRCKTDLRKPEIKGLEAAPAIFDYLEKLRTDVGLKEPTDEGAKQREVQKKKLAEFLKSMGVLEEKDTKAAKERLLALARSRPRRKKEPRATGLTNGLTKDTRKGLVNGLGRKDKNGMVNGLGKTNGIVNGMGKTNGLVNGLQKTRRGLTNGLTNGNGFTNGLGSKKFHRQARISRWKLFIMPLFATFLLMIPVMTPSSLFKPVLNLSADGSFSEWSSAVPVDANQSLPDSIDLLKVDIISENGRLGAYFEVAGTILTGNPVDQVPDVFQAYIDSDFDASSGYFIEGIGADYLLQTSGDDRYVTSSSLYQWTQRSSENETDWTNWEVAGHASVAIGEGLDAGKLEIAVDVSGNPPNDATSLAAGRTLFRSQSWDGKEDFSDYTLSSVRPSIEIIQTSVVPEVSLIGRRPLLELRMRSQGATVSLESIEFRVLGNLIVGDVTAFYAIDESDSVLGTQAYSGGVGSIEFTSPLSVGPSWSTITIEGEIASPVGRTLGLKIINVDYIGAPSAAVSLFSAPSARSFTYMGSIPQGIVIDGAYSDWQGAMSDAGDEPSTKGNKAVDIRGYDIVRNNTRISYYVRVQGKALKGVHTPIRLPGKAQAPPQQDTDRDSVPDNIEEWYGSVLPFDFNNDNVSDAQSSGDVDGDGLIDYPNGPDHWLNTTIPDWYSQPWAGRQVSVYVGPTAAIPPPNNGEDVLRIFVDTDEIAGSGYAIGGIFADYMIEIKGKNGKSLGNDYSRFTGSTPTQWSWTKETISAIALYGAELEGQIVIPGLPSSTTVNAVFDLRDWRGGQDSAESSTRGLRGLFAEDTFLGSVEETNAYVDEMGIVQAADLTLKPVEGHYSYSISKNGIASYFTGSSSQDGLMLLQRSDLSFLWQPTILEYSNREMTSIVHYTADVRAETDENQILYREVFPNVDDRYTVTLNRVKHDLIFESPPEPVEGGNLLSIKGKVLLSDGSVFSVEGDVRENEFSTTQDIQVISPSGTVLTLKLPYAHEQDDIEERVDGSYKVEKVDDGWILSMEVPLNWFLNPDRSYPVILDPTAIIDTSTSTSPTMYHYQRKIFHDGTYFWAFFYDGTNTVYEYSSDGMSWVNTKAQAFTTSGVQYTSTWYHDTGSSKIVYVAGDTISATKNVHVRKGTISGTTITWGSEYTAEISSQTHAPKPPFIMRGTNDYIWVAAITKEPGAGVYNFAVIRSMIIDDVSSWNAPTTMMSGNIGFTSIFGSVLPLPGGDVYAVWYAYGAIDGRKFTSGTGWGALENIDTGPIGIFYATPSGVVDSSGYIDLVYVSSTGNVRYRQRTTSWSSYTTLDNNAGNQYATISRETTSGDLYAFWKTSSNQINAQRYSGGSWTSVTLETNVLPKNWLTSIYSNSQSDYISWAWSEATNPSDVRFSLMSTPVKSVTVDTSTSSSSTRYSNQRKIFHDGTYFWAFYYHGGHTYYTYSSNGFTWTNGYTRLFTTSTVRNPSVWFYSSGATKTVYVVGDNDVSDTTVIVRKGTISGSTITWGSDNFVIVGSSGLSYKIPFICRDSSGYLWIVSNVMETNYNLAAVRSNGIDDVSGWGSYTLLMSSDITNNYIYGVVVPLDNEDVYALWYADGSIDGKRYTSGSWGSIENINTTTVSVSTKAPSVVVDSSYYVNLVFSNSTGSIIYRQRTSSWGTASVVTTTTNNVYPSITLQTTTGDFYTLWIDSSAQIAGKKYSSGSWTSMSGIDVSTITKNYLSTPYTISSDGGISWIWGQGGTTPYEVKFARIPEFPDVIAMTIVMLLLIIVLDRRRLRFLR